MKKIISGRLYDTDTAKSLGSYWNGCGAGDFNYLCEELYQKKTGEYFLCGTGGALSKYRKYVANGSVGSTEIIPYTEEEARAWAEKYLEADEYIQLFGNVAE